LLLADILSLSFFASDGRCHDCSLAAGPDNAKTGALQLHDAAAVMMNQIASA
jgi:hypothetical protein